MSRLDAAWWAGLLHGLREGYNVRLIARAAEQTVIVETPYSDVTERSYAWWTITDNGGELNVERINHHESLRPVAYLHNRFGPVDPGTMAYRVAMVLQDAPIDYDLLAEDLATL